MKVLTLISMCITLSAANQLISLSVVESLFTKFMFNDLTIKENEIFENILEIFRRPEYISGDSLERSSSLRVNLDCIVCRSIFSAAFRSVNEGQTDDQITDSITTLCVRLGIESITVCEGAVALNVPIIAHIIRTTPEARPNTFCGLVLQNAGDANTCPFDDSRFEWQVDLPDKIDTNTTSIHDGNTVKVAIITDAHIDPLYEAGGVADCDEPTCCRKGQTPAARFTYQPKIDENLLQQSLIEQNGVKMLNLSISNEIRHQKISHATFVEKRQSEPAGYWGDYRNCDTPLWAFDDAVENIHENHKEVDMVYYIGDTIDHGVWETSYDLINEMNRYVIQKIRKTFGDDVLVLPTIGNHESQPTNQFAPSSVTGAKINTTWLYEALANKWDFYLPDEAKESLRDRGDFSVLAKPGLRVISLNNNVAYKYNWWLVYDPLDSKKHLDWLVQELHKAELAGEKVHILAHIPPGVHDLIYTWTREYNRIVNRFTATIAGEFNGHTHSDEFKIFYNSDNQPINVAWGIGSITSYTFYNLNYKIGTFNGNTFVPENILNYAYNLTEANLTPNRSPHWFLLYDMKNSFELANLSADSLNEAVYAMVTNKRNLLDLYAAYYSKLSDSRWPNCNDNCKIDNLCKTVVTVLWERQKCEELRNLFFA